jgi:hypothetical protein
MRDGRDNGSLRWRRVRLGLYVAAIATASTVWVARRAGAELAERAFVVGRQLDRMAAIEAGTSSFEVNGARMSLTTITRKESVTQLLDRFAGLCGRDSGGISAQLDALGDKVPDGLRRGQFGVFRDERGAEGVAACFAREHGSGVEDLVGRAQQFIDSGDFAAFGQLRFLWTRDLGNGERHVLSVSSLGALPLDTMFPEHGDAPGKDLSFGVRPDGATRLISAHIEGGKFEGALYVSKLPPEEALAGYEIPLQKLGFERADLGGAPAELVSGARVFLRHDETVLVFAQPHQDSTTVSSFRLAHGGFVSVKMP